MSEFYGSFVSALQSDKCSDRKQAIYLYSSIAKSMEAIVNNASYKSFQQNTASKIVHCLNSRINVLKGNTDLSWPSLKEIQRLKTVLNSFPSWYGVFPILVIQSKPNSRNSSRNRIMSNDTGNTSLGENNEVIQLSKAIPKQSNMSRLAITLEKLGVKNPERLYRPHIVISLRDSDSVPLTPSIKTPFLHHVEDFHFQLNFRVDLQRYMANIPKASSIFFELKHTWNGVLETKCFALLPREYLSEKNLYLQLFKGPTDFSKKRLKKLSQKKPLYLHCSLELLDS